MKNILLLTDIGGDIDDTIALYTLIACREEVNIVGVVVCGGEHKKRAFVVDQIFQNLNVYHHIPIIAEANDGHLLSSHEFFMPDDFADLYTPEDFNAHGRLFTSNQHIIDIVNRYYGELILVAIGPLTPLADAIRQNEHFTRGIKQFYLQGQIKLPIEESEGLLPDLTQSYNLREDKESSNLVFKNLQENHVPFVCLGKHAAYKCPMTKSSFIHWSNLKGRPIDLYENLRNCMKVFWDNGAELLYSIYKVPEEYQHEDKWFEYLENVSFPYDPLLIVLLVRPELFDTSNVVLGKHILIGNDPNAHDIPDPAVISKFLTDKVSQGSTFHTRSVVGLFAAAFLLTNYIL